MVPGGDLFLRHDWLREDRAELDRPTAAGAVIPQFVDDIDAEGLGRTTGDDKLLLPEFIPGCLNVGRPQGPVLSPRPGNPDQMFPSSKILVAYAVAHVVDWDIVDLARQR